MTLRLLETIAAVARQTRDPRFRTALHRQADAIHRGSQEGLADSIDREDAKIRFRQAVESLNGEPPQSFDETADDIHGSALWWRLVSLTSWLGRNEFRPTVVPHLPTFAAPKPF